MSIDPASAAAAYTATLQTASGAASAATPQAGEKFSELLQNVVGAISRTGSNAETHAVAGATEDAELVDVVTSIAAAQLTLETVVAVRDKVIAAYQDIMKMPI